MKNDPTQINLTGQVVNAAMGGGEAALENMARGRGPAANVARQVLSLALEYGSLYAAIDKIVERR